MPRDFTYWEQHSDMMAADFAYLMRRKYEAGQKQHGGKLWRKPMLAHMRAEIVDLVNYFLTHEAQVAQAIEILEKFLVSLHIEPELYSTCNAGRALNVLKYGNEDGEFEEELDPDTWEELPEADVFSSDEPLQGEVPAPTNDPYVGEMKYIDEIKPGHPFTDEQIEGAKEVRAIAGDILKNLFPNNSIELVIDIKEPMFSE